MKNKRLDFRRRIDIYVDEPRPLDAAVLADHHTTRAYLHARLPGVPPPARPAGAG